MLQLFLSSSLFLSSRNVQDSGRFHNANHLTTVDNRDDGIRCAHVLVIVEATTWRRHVAPKPLASNFQLGGGAERDEARAVDSQPRHRGQLSSQLGRVHATYPARRYDGAVVADAQPTSLTCVGCAEDVTAHERRLYATVVAFVREDGDAVKGNHDILDGRGAFIGLANGAAGVVASKDAGHAAGARVELLRAGKGERVTHGEGHGGARGWRRHTKADCLGFVDGCWEEDCLALCRALSLLHHFGLHSSSGEDNQRQAQI